LAIFAITKTEGFLITQFYSIKNQVNKKPASGVLQSGINLPMEGGLPKNRSGKFTCWQIGGFCL
jgi:hypothetical protein